MAVSGPRNPKRDVDAVINRGGAPTRPESDQVHAMTLRLPDSLVRDLDAHLEALPYRMSRTAYILQAVHAQLRRDRDSSE